MTNESSIGLREIALSATTLEKLASVAHHAIDATDAVYGHDSDTASAFELLEVVVAISRDLVERLSDLHEARGDW